MEVDREETESIVRDTTRLFPEISSQILSRLFLFLSNKDKEEKHRHAWAADLFKVIDTYHTYTHTYTHKHTYTQKTNN